MSEFPKLYDLNKTAAAIGIKPRVLRHWIQKGEVTPPKIGGKFYFLPEMICKLLQNKLDEIENDEMEKLENE